MRFQNSPQTHLWECFLVFGHFSSFKAPFLGQISVLSSFVSLFIFYILFYLILKTMGCLSECLMSSAIIWKLFCGIFSAFKCSFDEFMRDKVASPSYSSAILGSSLQRSHLHSQYTETWLHYMNTEMFIAFNQITCNIFNSIWKH